VGDEQWKGEVESMEGEGEEREGRKVRAEGSESGETQKMPVLDGLNS